MKTYFKSEKGYALLLTLAVLILFSILGLSLLTLTASGVIKNETRQHQIQSQDLADKGITFIVEETQHYLETALSNAIKAGQSGMTKDAFTRILEDTIDKRNIKCDLNSYLEIPGEKGNISRVCIENIKNVSTEEKDAFKRVVTYRSTGISGGKQFVVRQTIILGTDAVPDQLRYAVSTNNDGDLYFHGGVEVQGDVKSAGNIYINKNAHWIDAGSIKWENSVALKTIPDKNSITSKFILTKEEKNIYYFERSSGNYDSYHGLSPKETINIKNPNRILNLKKSLTDSNNIAFITKEAVNDSMEIESKIKEIYSKRGKAKKYYDTNVDVEKSNHSINNFNKQDIILISGKESCKNSDCTLKKANFTINPGKSESTIKLRGSYYVNGDVKITNTNLESDAVLYINGSVTITESTLNGITPESTLIIFATGDIKINNISEYKSKPSTIKGFFYTESDMIMYGVGSNIHITGGLSAQNLRLTAVRGDVSYSPSRLEIIDKFPYVRYIPDGLNILKAEDQKRTSSRLKISYDENLVSQYTTFPRGLETEFITSINEPRIMNRY